MKENKRKGKKKKKSSNKEQASTKLESNDKKKDDPTKIDKMSGAGVSNAFWGTLGANAVTGIAKNAFKRESDMPATKGDIEELIQIVDQRYFPIVNYNDPYGRKAFYDKDTCQIVLFNEQMNRMELP
ncbi:hypothetical protein [uncultured Lutibacter sp.]|uniref:hypothetical protein n=1 Tax=uncultured Lutibacter sp. TaxID=437739 RepID=UPI00261EF2A5|nr:hypothetical protein [uncultured Lutibacter sp.]